MSAIPEPKIDFISEFHYKSCHHIIDNLKCFLLEIFLSETAARALLMIRVRTSRLDPRNAPIQKTNSRITCTFGVFQQKIIKNGSIHRFWKARDNVMSEADDEAKSSLAYWAPRGPK